MRFGPVDPSKAAGCILAHSISLGQGKRLRKGRVLTREDVSDLQAAGVTAITVAALDADDVPEDEAAEMLARAFVPDPAAQGVERTKAFTGRVNLLATGPGVVEMDVAAVEAVNRVHPMITMATVPPYQQMHPGGMVATIKIISYAVPRDALAKACSLAREAIRVTGPVLASVRLIISEIPGGAGDKGWRAISDRVAAFGLQMSPPVMVAHTAEALADALLAQDSDLTLILTGSATSDPEDVAPAAVRAAGGQVDRFGMPVDPGNLLFIGSLKGAAVIGLPGCARSPALNGADWVMSRVICGIPVRDADIAAMGVGGLLKEIPTRPQPRRGRPGTPA
ncbi:MAG: molybdopterin-binding protein [Pseudomonadota bacterium]